MDERLNCIHFEIAGEACIVIGSQQELFHK